MSDKQKTPETIKGVINATRIGSHLLSPVGTLHEHPINALNPSRAYGTAASQFWFELQHHFIEIVVCGNQTYTLYDPASQRDLRALVQHPGIRTKEMLQFAYRKRNELNIFNDAYQVPSSNLSPPPPPAAAQFHHMNFHFNLQARDSPKTLCGFDLRRAILIPQRFPNLKSIVIHLNVYPGPQGQSFTMPETMRVQFATVLLMQGVTRDAMDAVASVDEACRQERETVNGVLVKVMQRLREILGEKVEKRYVYLTRDGRGLYRPSKDLGREVMGEMPVDPKVIANVMMSEEGQRWLIPF